MISQQHFETEFDYDEQGLAVVVTHRPTGMRRIGRRSGSESLARTQTRLIEEIRREFFNPDEFQFSIGQCEVDGRIAAWYCVTHRPTGKNKSADGITIPNQHEAQQQLLDALVAELWQQGIGPNASA
jgi:hypothetical protein